MRTSGSDRPLADEDVFSADEIARAARVPAARVVRMLRNGPYATRTDAVRIVRQLKALARRRADRAPLTILPNAPRRQGLPLLVSGMLHAMLVAALVVLGSGLFEARETEQTIVEPPRTRLVFIMALGPGGGGGGGGLKAPLLPARAERKAPPKPRKVNSPVPAVRKAPSPPRSVEPPPKPPEPPKIDPPPIVPPRVEPPKPDPPKVDPPPQSVQAPVVPSPADAATRPGVLAQPPSRTASAGPGTGGGVGTGAGPGIGEGRGGGIGAGSGGGTGGGPFQPGAGIAPPSLVREVKPLYTDEARRRSIEGAVVLEVVVRRDGTVGSPRVLRRLGAGLDERAIEAVRQWRFTPAMRQGSPVDVVVEISVDFRLR